MTTPDEANTPEDIARAVQVAVMAAAFVGDAIARMHARSLAEAAPSVREQQWLSERLDKERKAARDDLRCTLNDERMASASAFFDRYLAHNLVPRVGSAWVVSVSYPMGYATH